jgi:uncharacterized protein with FMN-binding domain
MNTIAKIKKYLVSSVLVVVFVFYVVAQRTSDTILQKQNESLSQQNNTTDIVPVVEIPPTPISVPPPSVGTKIKNLVNNFDDDDDDGDDDDGFFQKSTVKSTVAVTPAKPVSVPVANTPANTIPTTKSAGIYKDGSYNGSVVWVRDGDLQTQAVIQGGKLFDVKFLILPNGSTESTKISNRSLPILRTEAIVAQSAKVNAVSGATLTSPAFSESLGVALALAKR